VHGLKNVVNPCSNILVKLTVGVAACVDEDAVDTEKPPMFPTLAEGKL